MGRKRAYAPLDVYMNGRRVGQYFRAPDGAFAFTYAPEWLAWENTLPISRALPLCVSACNFDPLRRGIGVQF